MFSSLSTSLSNLYNNATFSVNLSPQAILASYLATSVAEFLQVDSHLIETSLFTDQHVKLHQIQLKPRTVKNNKSASTLTGTIQLIEFRWEWDTQTYISNVRLNIVGVNLRLSKDYTNETSQYMPKANDSSDLPSNTEDGSQDADWKAVYMQQILDHLSVSISDVRITICLDDKVLIVAGSGIDLTTNNEQHDCSEDSLLQLLDLQSLSAYFEEPNGEHIQLLDAFGYSASVHRVSGRRFVDGIMNGLMITGQPRESIQWYLGATQVDGVLQLLQLLRVVEPDIDMSLPEPSICSDRSKSSVFEFPLASMTILMEENIKMLFKEGVIQYRTDGSECILQLGKASVDMNGKPLAVLNNLTIDVINESVLLSKPQDDCDAISVKLPLHTEMVERCQNVCSIYSKVKQDKNDVETVDVGNDASRDRPWSLDIQGTSKIEVSNELGWMQWSMENLSVFTKSGNKVPFDASWECAHLSSSHGVMMDVSMMELLDDTFRLTGSMNVTVTSTDAATQFLEFLKDAASNYTSDESQSTEILFNVVVPKINAVILEPDGGMQFECENVEVEGASLTLRGQRVQVNTALNGISSNYFCCDNFHTAFELIGKGNDQVVKAKIIGMCGVQYLSSVRVQSLCAEAIIDSNNISSINAVSITADEAVLTADFRSDRWSKQIENDSEVDPIFLPNVNVSKINLTLHFIGTGITLENTKIGLPAFKGNATTRSDELASHYVKLVKKRLPFLLTKTNVAGVNVGDSISSAVATVAVQSSLVGTLVGVVGKDGVGAAITAGKATRGASESERYHFGDFSKGLAASARSASMSGATMRGDDKYQVGDFSAGVAAASSNYASENRVRLSSAAGSGVGMVAGLALAGPVGLIAGSILAGKAVGNAVERRYGNPKNTPTYMAEQREEAVKLNSDKSTTEPPSDAFLPQISPQMSREADLPSTMESNQSLPPSSPCLTTDNGIPSCPSLVSDHPPHHISQTQENTSFDTTHASIPTDNGASTNSQSGSGGTYKLRNITRGIIARGKAARSANNNADGYKFGDFTRGLFG